MTQLHFETTVPDDGRITLPEEFRGKKFKMVPVGEELSPEDEKMSRILEADYNFRHPKTIDQIIEEQGGKPIRSIEDLCPKEPIWESDEEFFKFLEAMEIDVENYRSIEYLWKEKAAK